MGGVLILSLFAVMIKFFSTVMCCVLTCAHVVAVEKLTAINVLLQGFGNCRTLLNTNASRYTQITTIDYDPSGVIASASVQVCGILVMASFSLDMVLRNAVCHRSSFLHHID